MISKITQYIQFVLNQKISAFQNSDNTIIFSIPSEEGHYKLTITRVKQVKNN